MFNFDIVDVFVVSAAQGSIDQFLCIDRRIVGNYQQVLLIWHGGDDNRSVSYFEAIIASGFNNFIAIPGLAVITLNREDKYG